MQVGTDAIFDLHDELARRVVASLPLRPATGPAGRTSGRPARRRSISTCAPDRKALLCGHLAAVDLKVIHLVRDPRGHVVGAPQGEARADGGTCQFWRRSIPYAGRLVARQHCGPHGVLSDQTKTEVGQVAVREPCSVASLDSSGTAQKKCRLKALEALPKIVRTLPEASEPWRRVTIARSLGMYDAAVRPEVRILQACPRAQPRRNAEAHRQRQDSIVPDA
jgi:hypothetical protein